MNLRKTLLRTRGALVATLVGGTLIATNIGPGGVTMQHGTPPDHYGPTSLDRTEFPHCVDPADFKGYVPATSIIVNDWGQVREVPFGTAWDRNHDLTTINNVRVIGSCR